MIVDDEYRTAMEIYRDLQICLEFIEELSHGCGGDPENIVSDAKDVLRKVGYRESIGAD